MVTRRYGREPCAGTPAGNCAHSNPNSPVQTFVAYATNVSHWRNRAAAGNYLRTVTLGSLCLATLRLWDGIPLRFSDEVKARLKSLVQRGKNLAGAANPCLKSRLDVLVADVAMERCLRHELGRLFAHPAH